ncbi:MAG: hypothetical protein WB800_18280 [Streptosporangiaceae bacterium]
MSLVAPALESARAADRSRERARTLTPWLVGCCYLLGAVAVTCRLGADPAARAQVGDVQDVNLFAWFMRYEATAIAHGRLPALTTAALNAPHGISMMWNTSVLLPGVLLAPVTLLAGPQTSLTLMLTLGFAGSATSLFVVLRRWGASLTAAAIGGAVYGFSPALLNSGIGHYNLQFAVLPPLIIDALLRIVTGRGNAVRTGAWLGVLAAAQLFTGEELLTDTALAGLVLVVVLVAGQPRAARVKARHAGTGIATGVAVMLVICGHAMWAQFHGPLKQHYQPRFTHYTSYLSAHPAVFVTPAGNLLFHTPANAAAAAQYPTHLPEYLAYLGWPLLVVLVAGAIRYWRHPRVRVMAVTFAVLELVSLGDSYRGVGPFLPWHWLQGLPVLGELIPDRLAILADGAAAAVLAFALDRARQAESAERRWGHRAHLATAVAVLAVLPLTPLPYAAAAPTPVPAGWQAAFARLRLAPGARVLVVPIPEEHFTQPMRWQADTAEPASMIGGYFLGPNQSGQTKVSPGLAGTDAQYLDPLWTGKAPSVHRSLAQLRADVAYWRPAAVIDVLHRRSRLGPVLTALFGRPAFKVGRLLVWRL